MKIAVLLFIAVLLGFFFTSCEKDENTGGQEEFSLVGKTYENQAISVTFESSDSASFYSRFHPESTGKARYFYRGHTVEILNPYERRLKPEQVKVAYLMDFVGEVNTADKLEHVRYFFIGPGEREQSGGGDSTFWLVEK